MKNFSDTLQHETALQQETTLQHETKARQSRDARQVAELVLWLVGMVGALIALGWPA